MTIRAAAPRLALAALLGLFIAAAWPGTSRRGLIAEEVQPYLRRHPTVLEWSPAGGVAAMPPEEPGAPSRPRLVATSQWPVLAWDGEARMWPLFLRGHQSALGAAFGLLVGPWLGEGMVGVRRSHLLLGALLIALTALLGRRLCPPSALLAAALAATSLGLLWLAATGYGFELTSRILALAALVVAAGGRWGGRRAVAVGLLAGLAILSRATIAVTLAPTLAVLAAAPARRPTRRGLWTFAAAALALPVVIHGLVALLAPFRPDAAPLGGFPLGALLGRTLAVGDQLSLQLAWIADARVILGPLIRGQLTPGPLLVPTLLALLPWLVAGWRNLRDQATEGERLILFALPVSALAGAWLYGPSDNFQLALGLEPLFAVAVAGQLVELRLPAGWRPLLVATLLGARGIAAAAGLIAEARNANPMLSQRTQRAAAATLDRLRSDGRDLLTVAYNQAGILEAQSGDRLRPRHAWPLFAGARGASLEAAWEALLRQPPRYVLLVAGPNLFEGSELTPAAITAALQQVAPRRGLVVTTVAELPTEAGGPGWTLVRLDGAPR